MALASRVSIGEASKLGEPIMGRLEAVRIAVVVYALVAAAVAAFLVGLASGASWAPWARRVWVPTCLVLTACIAVVLIGSW